MKAMLRTGLLLFVAVQVVAAAENCQVYSVSPQAAPTSPGSNVVLLGAGFSKDSWAYFDGAMARETTFLYPSRLEVVTPYLRPGQHFVQVDCPHSVTPAIPFQSLTSAVDAKLDAALTSAQYGQSNEALQQLEEVARAESDYQVRAYARYERARIYFRQGDWNDWAAETMRIFDHAKLSGHSIQTYWPYRLEDAREEYLMLRLTPADDSSFFDWPVELDVTENPTPRFYRGVFNARIGQLAQAKSDALFCLQREPSNAAYLALAALVAALSGDKQGEAARSAEACATLARHLPETNTGAQERAGALSLLGHAAYIAGDLQRAQRDWLDAQTAHPSACALALLAAKKHLWRGESGTAAMLLREAVTEAPPNGTECSEAGKLLQAIPRSSQ